MSDDPKGVASVLQLKYIVSTPLWSDLSEFSSVYN